MMLKRLSVIALGPCILMSAATSHALAQPQQVTVSGVVVQRSQSAPIRGATVRLSGSPPYVTDLTGRFQFNRVPPGRYTISVEAVGYRVRSLELMIRADTTLQIEIDRDPVVLEPIVVRARGGNITIKGSIRDAVTRQKLLQAQVTIYPGSRTVGALSGAFTLKDVPRGDQITIVFEALEHLPDRIEFVADKDTTVTVDMKVDSVALRMIAQQVKRLNTRSLAIPYSVKAMGRDDIRRSGGSLIGDLVRRHLPPDMFTTKPPYRPAQYICVVYDDVPVEWDVLLGLPPELIERVEIFGFRGKMIRAYSKPYVAALMSEQTLPRIVYMDNGLRPVCS